MKGRICYFLLLCFALTFTACSSDSSDDMTDDTTGDPTGGDTTGDDTGTPSGNGATLTGVVTRSAEPAAGGVGDLFISVFTVDPVTDAENAETVAIAVVEDADMSAADAAIAYTITEVPPRAEPYFVTAFLDDNHTVGDDPATAGPDRGDLVALDGFASPSLTIDSETTVDFDIDLNFNLPF